MIPLDIEQLPSGGNYWSNWIEPDEYTGINQDIPRDDSFVDSPFSVSGASNQDRYPFTIQNGWEKPLFTPNVLLVGFNPDVSVSAIDSTIAEYDTEIIEYFEMIDIYFLYINDPSRTESEVVYMFEDDPNVDFAVEDYYTYPSHLTEPNDPSYSKQWGLNNRGQNVGRQKGLIDVDIDAPQAWEHKTNVTNVNDIVVAVIDTGVDLDQPDIARNLWKNTAPKFGDSHGAGFKYNPGPPRRIDKSGTPYDTNGHGTHCAGIIGAVGNNGIGVSGVNWRVHIMAIKTDAKTCKGRLSVFSAAINYIMKQKAAGVNVRLISYSRGISRVALMRVGLTAAQAEKRLVEIRKAYAKPIKKLEAGPDGIDGNNDDPDILFITAAGNDGVNIDYKDKANNAGPSIYPCKLSANNLICVAASNNRDNLACFSNYGKTSVDLFAPGDGILSLAMHGQIIYNDTDSGGAVSSGDKRLTKVAIPPYAAGTVVKAGDTDDIFKLPGGANMYRVWPLVAFKAKEKHDEVVGNRLYDTGEHIYNDSDSNSKVSTGDTRLTDVLPLYVNGSVVKAKDTDVGNRLVAFGANERHDEIVPANRAYDNREHVYTDADGSGAVNVGDTRKMRVVFPYRVGSKVVVGDSDIADSLIAFKANEKHDEIGAANKTYDAGEHSYVDADGNGKVSAGDRRLMDVRVRGRRYAAGTVVAVGDVDVGNALVPFRANERYSIVTYKSGTSMATPFVSGAAAHCMSLFPNETHLQIKQRLQNGIGAPGAKPSSGVDPILNLQNTVLWGNNFDGRLRMCSGDDFGDAPDPKYPTKTRKVGASHEDIGEEWLGADVSPEYDADKKWPYDVDREPNLNPSDTDHYDDGVILYPPYIAGKKGKIVFTVSTENPFVNDSDKGRYDEFNTTKNPKKKIYVNAYFDWNADGDWDDTGEHIVTPKCDGATWWGGPGMKDYLGNVWSSPNKKTITIEFVVPTNAKCISPWVRVRLDYGENVGKLKLYESDNSLNKTKGLAQFGEVEDYPPCIEVKKTVWDPVTKKWVESRVAKKCNYLKFKCTIHPKCCNLTNIVVKDVLSKSLNYTSTQEITVDNVTIGVNTTVVPGPGDTTYVTWTFQPAFKLKKCQTMTIIFDVHKKLEGCDKNTQIIKGKVCNKTFTVTSNTVDIFDINVNKTVWDPVTEKWVESRVAKKCDDLTFNCTIHPKCCNLTNIAVKDVLSESLNYTGTQEITVDNETFNVTPTVEPGPDNSTNVTWTFPPAFKLKKCQTLTIIFDAHKKLEECDNNTQIVEGKACNNKTWVTVKSNTVDIFDVNVKKEVWNPATGRWDTSRVAKVCDPLLFRCNIHPKCCNLTKIEVIDILSESLNYTYTENITIDDVSIDVTPTVEVEPGPDNTTHVTWTFPPDFKLEKCQNMVIHFFAHKVKCYDDWNTQIVIAKACNKTWVTMKSNTVDIIEAPGLTAKQLRNVVAEDNDYTIEGTATCVDYVDIVLIGPDGYPSGDPGLDVVNGFAITSTSVTDDEFSENITMKEGLDTGMWKAMVFSPGRDVEYGDLYLGAGELDRIPTAWFAGKNQDQIVVILLDHTINVAGSDDLLESFTFKVESPFVKLNPIESVAVGEPLVVTGTLNRPEGYMIVVICKGPVELPPQSVKIENGTFSATFDTSESEEGTYTVKADDGDGHTDELDVVIYGAAVPPSEP